MSRPINVPSGGGAEGGWDDAIGSGRFHPDAPGQGWDDLRAAQIRFDRRDAWHVEAPPGVAASFQRVLREDGVGYGQWTVRDVAAQDRLRLQPAKPVILAEPFDTIELAWGLSTPGAGLPDDAAGRLRVVLRFEDADGHPLRVEFPDVPHRPDGETVLVQRNLGYAFLEHARFPFRWLGMDASGWPDGATLTIGAIVTYPQCRVPLVPEWREEGIRARPLHEELSGRAPALPKAATRADGTVPSPRGDPPRHGRHREADGAWLLEARTEHGIAAYRIPPPTEPPEIALHWNGRAVGTWAGLSWDSADPTPAQAVAHVDGDDLVWAWPCGREQRFRLCGASLVVSLRGGRDVSGVRVGGVGRPFVAQSIPFLSDLPGAGPAVFARSHASEGRLWVSVAADWTVSGASVIAPPPSESAARAIAVHLYRPATDRARSWLHERVAVTLGPDLAAVLPRPPWAPPGEGRTARVEARPWLGDDASPEETRAALSPFGMDAWQPIASPAPEEATPWGRAIARDALTPDGAEWSRDRLRRTPDGNWMPGDTPGSYARKRPPVRLAARLQIEQWGDRPAPEAVMAGLTAHPPWAFTDYDARSPGAAGFRAALHALAGQLRDLAESLPALRLGPDDHVFAYAGLLDAWVVGSARGQRIFHGLPRPEAAQQALREHGIGIGVGPLESVVATSPEHPNAEHALDRYLAVHLAYGLALRAPPLRYGARRIGRLYFAGGAVTRARAGRPVEALAFPDHTAAPADAASRIYIRYEGGLEVWVNLARHHDWEVRVAGATYLLPPSGWVARSGEILALAVRDGGGRIDAARTPALVYRDGRGRGGAFEGIDSAGALVLLRDAARPAGIDVIDLNGEGEWRLAFDRFDLGPNPRVDAFRIENGAPVDAPSVTREGDWLRIRGPRAPTRYRLAR